MFANAKTVPKDAERTYPIVCVCPPRRERIAYVKGELHNLGLERAPVELCVGSTSTLVLCVLPELNLSGALSNRLSMSSQEKVERTVFMPDFMRSLILELNSCPTQSFGLIYHSIRVSVFTSFAQILKRLFT